MNIHSISLSYINLNLCIELVSAVSSWNPFHIFTTLTPKNFFMTSLHHLSPCPAVPSCFSACLVTFLSNLVCFCHVCPVASFPQCCEVSLFFFHTSETSFVVYLRIFSWFVLCFCRKGFHAVAAYSRVCLTRVYTPHGRLRQNASQFTL